MKILITGAKGMVGKALWHNLNNIKDGLDKSHPSLHIGEVFAYDINSNINDLNYYCKECDFVFHLAGVNRVKDNSEFKKGNYDFSAFLLNKLKENNNKATVMLSSSIQAAGVGRFKDSAYGQSKKECEDLFFAYSKETGTKVAVYRFVNVMGPSRPNYNSAISTFCYSEANDKPYIVNDPRTELDVVYIDDIVQGMIDLLENKEVHCDYELDQPIIKEDGKYCLIPLSYHVSLGEIVSLLQEFKQQPLSLLMPKMPNGSFAKKLFSLYLSYLPKEKMKYALKMNVDQRGSFTELVHTLDCGQISINVSKPGITKGQHWHNSKWEQFIVVSGHGLIQERKIDSDEVLEFEVSGDKIEAVYMLPGYTHNIINLSKDKDLVTVMTCNEIFDPNHPDTFYLPVVKEKTNNE